MVVVGVKIGDSREILYFNAGKLSLKKNLTVIVDSETCKREGELDPENPEK